jgi:hypothetical protein
LLAAAFLLTCLATPTAAQDGPNTGDLRLSGALDFSNAYFFRGIRQETEGLVIWPYLDVGLGLYEGEGALRAFTLNFGTWNSVHHRSQSGGDNPLNRKSWYESDFYATMGFAVQGGVNIGVTYTAYTSPNSLFTTVKEVSFKFAVDDSPWLGRASLKPYGLLAQEFDTGTGTGQADGGFCQSPTVNGCSGQGTYLELGVAPGYTYRGFQLALPVKVGIGLIDYYQALIPPRRDEWGSVFAEPGIDSKFGFASIAATATVPFTTGATRLGNWNVHGGVEYLVLGEMARYAAGSAPATPDGFPSFESNQWVATLGIGFSY